MPSIEDKILKNSAILISEEGLSSFSFTKLASMCNCSKSTLYSNYSNKEDLIIGIYIKNINEIVNFNLSLLNNKEISNSDAMILACMYDVFRVYFNYKHSDRISMIATIPRVYDFCSKNLMFNLRSALLDLNDTFIEIENKFVNENGFTSDEIKKLMNTYRLHARGIVSCISNKVYFESCIESSIEMLYDNYKSIIDLRILNGVSMSFIDVFNFINDYLTNSR